MRERLIEFGWNSLSRGIGLAVCVAIIYAATAILDQVPSWFGKALPSVVTTASWQSFRDKDQAAFTIANEKVRPGEPLSPIFHAQAQDDAYSPPVGLSVHRCRSDNSRIEERFKSHAVGETWSTRYCFDMPGTFSTRDKLSVTGYLVHRRWFGEVHEPIPALTIDPVP